MGVSNGTDVLTGLMVVIVLAYAIGDYASNKTKAVFSMIFVTAAFVVSNEVSMVLSNQEEERSYVLNRILPKMLIGGFTTVTIGSVVLAGYLAKIIITSGN